MTLCLGLACAGAGAGPASGYRFQIVTADDSSVTRHIADDLHKRLLPLFTGYRTELAQQRRMVVIAVGPLALRKVLERKMDGVIVSAFTSSQVWQALRAPLAPARAAAMTAVYAEPAPADQLRLVALLYRRPVRIGAILSADTGFLAPALNGAAEVETFAEGDDINRVLGRMAQAQVLLALPDRRVYNTENIRNILLSSYRHNQGVIGFSADMVRAGALASTYSEVEDIDTQVAEIVAAFVADGALAPPQFPHYFATVINEGVARSLGIDVDAAARGFARRRPARRP